MLTLFRMDFFRAAEEWGGGKKAPLPKICHTYPTMIKRGTVIPYLRKMQKYKNHVTRRLNSAYTSIFHWKLANFDI